MDNLSYSALGRKNYRTSHFQPFQEELSLLAIPSKDLDFLSEKDLALAYCNELKNILELEDIYQIIDRILALQNRVNGLLDLRSEAEYLPNMSNFFSGLSPLLLQALWENNRMNDELDSLFKRWIEALRIALEEEISFCMSSI